MNAVAESLVPAAIDDMPPPLVFTDSAAAKVKDLVDEEARNRTAKTAKTAKTANAAAAA